MKINHFSERNIRPKEHESKKNIAILLDVSRLLSKSEEFVKVNCPACNSKKSKIKFHKQALCYVECQKCETLYMNPRPTQEVLEWLYKDSELYNYWNKTIFPSSEPARIKHIVGPRIDFLSQKAKELNNELSSLLEVGPGYGSFSGEIQRRKVFNKVVVVEASDELAKTCISKQLDTRIGVFEKIDFPDDEKFDVITSFEVIEHLFSPKVFLDKAHELLNSNGLLFMTCPNGKGFDYMLLGRNCGGIDHEHLNYFNTDSIEKLLSGNGFEVIDVQTPGRLDAEIVHDSITHKDYDTIVHPFFQELLINRWATIGQNFQDFLANNKLSSSMQILARKK